MSDGPVVLLTAHPVLAYNRRVMHHLIACVFCGGDPSTDSLLLQAAIAGGITTPWMLRSKLRAMIGRLRGGRTSGETYDACPLPDDEDAEPPTSAR
jgi:hypothetical protein